MIRKLVGFCMAASLLLVGSLAQAGSSCGCGTAATPLYTGCATSIASPCCGTVVNDCCAVTYQTRTVYRTEWVTEMRRVMCTEYQRQEQVVDVTVYERVPRVEKRTRTYNVMVPKEEIRQVTYTVCDPVVETIEQTVHVCKPYMDEIEQHYVEYVTTPEVRQGTRMVPQYYEEDVTYTVCRDMGSWECRTYEVPVASGGGFGGGGRLFGGCRLRHCGGRGNNCCPDPCAAIDCCTPCTRTVTCRVWVPNIVHEELVKKVRRCKMVPEQFEYTVNVCTPVKKSRMVQVQRTKMVPEVRHVNVTRMVPRQVVKDVKYCTMVCETRSEECEVTVYDCVPRVVQRTCVVMVPVQVEREVPVRVCRRVACEVQVPVTCCPPPRGGLFSRLGRGRASACCPSPCVSACAPACPPQPRRCGGLLSRSRATSGCGC